MLETSLAVQRLGLCACTEAGEIPGRGNNILHAPWHGQKEKKNYQKLIFDSCYTSSGSPGVCSISPLHKRPEMYVWPAFDMMTNVIQRERASVVNHTLTGSLKLPPGIGTCHL